MFYLVYVSNAVRPFRNHELDEILRVSRPANEEAGVTGLLLYKDGAFMQFLEGSEAVVRELLDKIARDPRHYNVLTLQEGENDDRQFPDWSMGFQSIDQETAVPGYDDFKSCAFTDVSFREKPSRSLRLLRLFRDHA